MPKKITIGNTLCALKMNKQATYYVLSLFYHILPDIKITEKLIEMKFRSIVTVVFGVLILHHVHCM